MSQFIYLDFLRRVSPSQNAKDSTKPEFMLLGSFDALRVKFGSSKLQIIKQLHETGHESVASIYDRQPMFLFDSNDGYNETSPECLFSTKGVYASLPIIISIIQINKTEYARLNEASISDLVEKVKEIVKENIKTLTTKEQEEIRHWSVFWNLGEPDIVIVFRPEQISPVAIILHRMRVYSNSKVQIFSSCSHCGFPYQQKMQETKRALRKWLKHESSSDNIEYLSFVNTSSGYHNLKEGKFIFGEWDYIIKQDIKKELVDNLLQSQKYMDNPPYKTSYTLPAIGLDDLGVANGSQLKDDGKWIKEIKNSFDHLIDSIEKKPYIIDNSTTLIRSLSYTLTGLAKYLIRLFLGRYEQDLFTYTKPIFIALPKIVKSYQNQIEYLHRLPTLEESNKGNIICRLIMEFEEDITNLISGFQHLFSVLSISPHTYMETFGSNMRSLSAANKLIDAYQGLISFLCCYFPDYIDEKTTGQHHILIIPYRKSYPQHVLLFRSSSPLVRISKIEMDFPKMFRLGPSVFNILHECAHHLGNRLRFERWEDYCKACVYLAAESIVSNYILHPIDSFLSPTSTTNINASVAPLFYGMKEDVKKATIELFSRTVYMTAKDAIINIGNELSKILKEHMPDIIQGLAPHYSPIFQHQLYNSYTLNLIEDTFMEICSNNVYNIVSNIRDTLLDAINTYWISKMSEIARNLADYVVVNGGNQYEASLLIAKYKGGKIAVELVKNFPSMVRQKIQMGGFKDLQNIFSDVYSDVFAIRILEIPSFQKYCEMIHQFTGTAVNEAVINSKNLQRLAVIGKTCFNLEVIDGDGFEELIRANSIPVWKKEEIRSNWDKATSTSYFDSICNYARRCKAKMDESLSCLRSQPSINNYLDILNNVFENDTILTETSFIETFWKFLMRGND